MLFVGGPHYENISEADGSPTSETRPGIIYFRFPKYRNEISIKGDAVRASSLFSTRAALLLSVTKPNSSVANFVILTELRLNFSPKKLEP